MKDFDRTERVGAELHRVLAVMAQDGSPAMRRRCQERLQARKIPFLPAGRRLELQRDAEPAGLDDEIDLVAMLLHPVDQGLRFTHRQRLRPLVPRRLLAPLEGEKQRKVVEPGTPLVAPRREGVLLGGGRAFAKQLPGAADQPLGRHRDDRRDADVADRH